jgi:hypothetical protein
MAESYKLDYFSLQEAQVTKQSSEQQGLRRYARNDNPASLHALAVCRREGQRRNAQDCIYGQ